MTGPDYILDIDGLKPAIDVPAQASSFRGRPWLAVMWKCCSTYSRIYRDAEGRAYEGRCPRCRRAVNVKIGPGGTHTRFFEAS